jgi:hypothetical protein
MRPNKHALYPWKRNEGNGERVENLMKEETSLKGKRTLSFSIHQITALKYEFLSLSRIQHS